MPDPDSRLKDPFDYLPWKTAREFQSGHAIYEGEGAPDRLYAVLSGRVLISRFNEDGRRIIVRVVATTGLFGTPFKADEEAGAESAVALGQTSLISWTHAEIEVCVLRQPELGIALAQWCTHELLALQDRVAAMSAYQVPERVGVALIQLAAAVGEPMPDGKARIPALSHFIISDFVGTSRELVTVQMNRLRRLQLIEYCRSHTDVNVGALVEWLYARGITLTFVLSRPGLVRHAGG